MRIPSSTVLICVLGFFMAVATGCGTSRATVIAQGTPPLNLNDAGESTAVQVRLYPLKGEGNFRAATVEALWVNDKDALKDDLTGERVQFTVTPAGAGETAMRIEVPYSDSTRFIGVLALFPKADAKDNRTLIIPIERANGAKLVLSRYSVSLADR